jgi:Cell wall-active antibiotics response 4TMS YvqF
MVATIRSVAMRRLGVFLLGLYGGMLAAAALAKRALPSRGDSESDEVALVAIFGGVELESRAQAFRGGSLLAWFGGVAVDLRQAKLAPEARLTVGALFGGVDVKVPTGWRVVSTARAFAGGVSDDVPEPDDPAAPTLTVESTTAFGGISIRAVAADAVAS